MIPIGFKHCMLLLISLPLVISLPAQTHRSQGKTHNLLENISTSALRIEGHKTMRVAGLQMEVTADIETNMGVILAAIERAAEARADFLMTPEGSLSGYNSTFDKKQLLGALEKVLKKASTLQVGLLLGTCYKGVEGGTEKCWNQIRVYSPKGALLGAYSKILRCSPIDAPGTGEMLDYEEGQLQTFEWNNIRFGALVCNDLWATPGYTTIPNPYLALQLKKMGVSVIFHAINSGTNQAYRAFHESSVDLWAKSLQLPILEVNAAKGTRDINAPSGLVDRNGIRASPVPTKGHQFFVTDIEIDTPTD